MLKMHTVSCDEIDAATRYERAEGRAHSVKATNNSVKMRRQYPSRPHQLRSIELTTSSTMAPAMGARSSITSTCLGYRNLVLVRRSSRVWSSKSTPQMSWYSFLVTTDGSTVARREVLVLPPLLIACWGTNADARGDDAPSAAARMNPRKSMVFGKERALFSGWQAKEHEEGWGALFFACGYHSARKQSIQQTNVTMEFW